MSSQTPPSPKTPSRKLISWNQNASPLCKDSPGYCSTPTTSRNEKTSVSASKIWMDKNSPSKHTKLLGSPVSKCSFGSPQSTSRRLSQSFSKENDSEISSSFSKNASSTDLSWNVKTFSSTETNGTVTVELDFPHGGWDEEDSSDDTSCSLEIVESEAECNSSPLQRGRKRKQSEVAEEDNAILSGMGEEIERQLEAKAERNHLTVPNVKNILRSVITNPYVQAMVRRSIKSGDIAVTGDIDISFEPRMTRAKAKALCDNDSVISEVSWAKTPLKSQPASECQVFISEELNDDSEDDEEYQPGEDEPSDCDYSERDGSERGSERDLSIDQSPAAYFDTDTESCPATPSPSPKPQITDSATQTNWSEDGVFKVPMAPPEPQFDLSKEENIAWRTRSKLPLNDTPLEEIEQAFVPPDITPDLYDTHDTTCDPDWEEFLKEFMQPMRSEPEAQNHDDEEEDPEYNVLADEEIIDKEELRMDRAVKVSKRELNELMRELLEFTENMSSEDEDKIVSKEKGAGSSSNGASPGSNVLSNNEEMSLFLDAYMNYGTLAPMSSTKSTPPSSRSPGTPTLNTPIPPMSPPCMRTPASGKKGLRNETNSVVDSHHTGEDPVYFSGGKGKTAYSPSGRKLTQGKRDSFHTAADGKKQPSLTPGKLNNHENPSACASSGKRQRACCTPGKPDSYLNLTSGFQNGKKQNIAQKSGRPNNLPNSNDNQEDTKYFLPQMPGKLDSFNASVEDANSGVQGSEANDLIGVNTAAPVIENHPCRSKEKECFSPGKEYFLLSTTNHWDNDSRNVGNSGYTSVLEYQNTDTNWTTCNTQDEGCKPLSVQVGSTPLAHETANLNEPAQTGEDYSSDPELSVSFAVSNSPTAVEETEPEELEITGDLQLSCNGDVTIDNTVVLSAAQRLVLDQQMRQYIQLTTQGFLLTYKHPIFSSYAEGCKKQLVSIESKSRKKEKSAFKAANLSPALKVVKEWEEKLSSEEGSEIISFMEKEASTAHRQKHRRSKYVEQFCPQLMSLMANSKAFVYPQLLPHMPYRSVIIRDTRMMPSEDHLLAIGLEQFLPFIQENRPDLKGGGVSMAFGYVAQYLLVTKEANSLHVYARKGKNRRPNHSFSFYTEHKCAPPTSHIVIPFHEDKMIPLKEQPHNLLPSVWRNFLFPAID